MNSRSDALMRAWPLAGTGAGALLVISTFLPFPTVSPSMLREPSSSLVTVLNDGAATILVRNGLSWLSIALLVVFIVGLHREMVRAMPESLVPSIALAGGILTSGALLVGYGLLAQIAAAALEERDPTVVAAVYATGDGLAYGAWTGLGLVTAAVALASRHGVVPGWFGVISAVATVMFLVLAFFPYVAWGLAAVWLLLAGFAARASTRSHVSGRSAAAA